MGYLEKQQGLDPGDYSPTFLELDARSGPWLGRSQARSGISCESHPCWDLDPEQGIILFGDQARIGICASFQMLGTYDPQERVWLWAWSNPNLKPELCEQVALVRDRHPDVPELVTPTFCCSETKAWAVAAAAACAMEAESCFRLPGEIQTFVALFDITRLEPDDPRAHRSAPSPEEARQALAEYAGPMALSLGGLLVDALRDPKGPVQLDQVLAALHSFCDRLQELSGSPLGQGTPAAAEAARMATVLRQGALCLSLPPGSADLPQAAREVLSLLRDLARHFGAWPGQQGGREKE